MNKKYTFVGLMLLLVMSLVLLGVPMTKAQDATATPAPTATFEPSSEGTLTIWSDADRLPAIQSIAKGFTDKYNVPVRIQTMAFGDVRNNLQLGAPVGEGPDIIVGAHDWVGQLYGSGLLAPIDMTDDLKAKFDPVAIKAFTYDGKLVGLPYYVEAVGVYYNTDVVPELPATWADMVTLAQQLVKDGKVERGLAIPAGDPYHHEALFTGFGGYVFGRDADGNYNPKDVGLDSPGGIKAAQEIDRLVKAGVFDASIDYNAAQNLFTTGKLAMWVTGPWALGTIRKSGVHYAVAPIPPMEQTARPFVGAQGFMINSFSKNLLLAQAFLTDYVATDEGMKALYDAVPGIPAWTPLASTIDDKDLLQFRKAVANGDPMPAIPQMAAVWTAWGNAVNLIYQQQGDPEKIMKDAAQSIRDQIAKGSG